MTLRILDRMHRRQPSLFGPIMTQMLTLASTLVLFCQLPGFTLSAAETQPSDIVGRKVANFILKNQAGQTHAEQIRVARSDISEVENRLRAGRISSKRVPSRDEYRRSGRQGEHITQRLHAE